MTSYSCVFLTCFFSVFSHFRSSVSSEGQFDSESLGFDDLDFVGGDECVIDCDQEKGTYDELLSSDGDHDIDSDIYQDQKQTLLVTAEQVYPVCVKLNELLRRGKIDKKHIFYKHLNDVLEIFFDPFV